MRCTWFVSGTPPDFARVVELPTGKKKPWRMGCAKARYAEGEEADYSRTGICTAGNSGPL